MPIDFSADLDQAAGSEELDGAGQTTYVQPALLGLFSSFAENDLFSIRPMLARLTRNGIYRREEARARKPICCERLIWRINGSEL
jgi:hypothetical protein